MGRKLSDLPVDLEYGDECIVATDQGMGYKGEEYQVRAPAFPADCDYVRVVLLRRGRGRVRVYECAYWNADEWKEDPMNVMGAIMGATQTVREGSYSYRT